MEFIVRILLKTNRFQFPFEHTNTHKWNYFPFAGHQFIVLDVANWARNYEIIFDCEGFEFNFAYGRDEMANSKQTKKNCSAHNKLTVSACFSTKMFVSHMHRNGVYLASDCCVFVKRVNIKRDSLAVNDGTPHGPKYWNEKGNQTRAYVNKRKRND